MATIVTAFITKINNIEFRSYEKYIELGKKLLGQAIPTVCFLEKHIYDHYFANELNYYPLTIFKIFERNENYLYQYEDLLTDFHLETDNPTKDTPGYMFIQCHKTEWVKTAIEENPFKTNDFIWIDFGIFHMIRDDMSFATGLKNLVRKSYDGIRIPSCQDPSLPCIHRDIYRQIMWYFAGSMFGGNKDKLLQFAKIMKEFTIRLIHEKKHIMWEVNIWYLLYQNHAYLFIPYFSNHDLSILDNY
jgi:hypothetical protein